MEKLKIPRMLLTAVVAVITFVSYAQEKDVEASRQMILDEGKFLFRLEKASWHATDVLMKGNAAMLEHLAGYLSYADQEFTKTIFWNKDNKILLTVTFDSIASATNGIANADTRDPNEMEQQLMTIRGKAFDLLVDNNDKFFSFYKNTSPNLIPVIRDGRKVVFILTASKENKLLIGNDYKVVFGETNQVTEKIKLHNSLIPIQESGNDENNVGSMHTHILKNHPVMTSTDICTFLLYRDIFKLSRHVVVSQEWISIFEADKESFVIVPKSAFEKK